MKKLAIFISICLMTGTLSSCGGGGGGGSGSTSSATTPTTTTVTGVSTPSKVSIANTK